MLGASVCALFSFLAGKLLGAETQMSMTVASSCGLYTQASLLHDDLIDDADTRKGQRSRF
ncbi:MAG: polyprenyl synthetase family protein [Deinococcales bacterium]